MNYCLACGCETDYLKNNNICNECIKLLNENDIFEDIELVNDKFKNIALS